MKNQFLYLLVNSFLFFGCAPDLYLANEEFIHYEIHLKNKSTKILASPSMTFNISCTQVFGGLGTFTQNSIVITGTSGSIQILNNTNCSLTIQTFFDGTTSYSPNPTALVISITSGGVISSSGTIAAPPVYKNSLNANLYLYLTASTSSSLSFEYTYDPVAQPFTFIGVYKE